MGKTQEITKSAKELASLERKAEKLVSNEQVAVARATAKAQSKYTTQINAANAEVSDAKLRLQALVAAA